MAIHRNGTLPPFCGLFLLTCHGVCVYVFMRVHMCICDYIYTKTHRQTETDIDRDRGSDSDLHTDTDTDGHTFDFFLGAKAAGRAAGRTCAFICVS